jgi:hypothetical protein
LAAVLLKGSSDRKSGGKDSQVMKFVLLLTLWLGGVITTAAQDSAESQAPPGVTILGSKWSRRIAPPRRYEPPLTDASSGTTPGAPAGQTRPTMPVPNSPFPAGGALPYMYVYTLTVRDDGGKTIKAVAWEHAFTDPGSGRMLAEHKFVSFDKKGDGNRVATFSATSTSPPSKVVSLEGLGGDERSPYTESAEIMCVLYKDGTFWEQKGSGGAACEGLRRMESWRRRRR